ncbi:uncharacterized protein LOC119732635 [Patiria miniata]|uniref:Uncharacterized protein n=1 Tax=Patiria miniata TaxID=46514 RepID=A0A914AE33_PATMI|nr:uncharacterized protein LOC119732635 [Patiria miniata]
MYTNRNCCFNLIFSKELSSQLTWSLVKRIRNLIIMKIILSQAPRAGVIQNATLGQFLDRTRHVAPETFEDVYTIKVTKHKTERLGPATVILDEALEKQLCFYVRYARPSSLGCPEGIIKNRDAPLFLGTHGACIYKVSRVADDTWKSMGMPGKCGATILRKTAATKAVGELKQRDADQVAELMAHQPATQHAYYVAAQDTRDKIRACSLLATVLRKEGVAGTATVENNPPTEISEISVCQNNQPADDEVSQHSSCQVDESPSSTSGHSQPEPVMSAHSLLAFYGKTVKQHPQTIFSEKDKALFLQKFHSVKEREPGAALTRVADVILEDEHLRKKFKRKQVADKLRSMLEILAKKESAQNATNKTKCPTKLTDDQLTDHILREKKYLRNIFEGKDVACKRHRRFKQGRRSREELQYETTKGPFTDEQYELAADVLVKTFCPNNETERVDYVLKVLLPEALIRVAERHLDVSHEEAEQLFINSS